MHTAIQCDCGQTFNHLVTTVDLALAKTFTGHCACPKCGKEHSYSYEFSAEFHCKRWWKPWKTHCITEHFSVNKGNMETECYPRHCHCDEDILLHQRRTK